MYYLGVGDYKLEWFTDIYVGLVGKAEAWFGIPASGDWRSGRCGPTVWWWYLTDSVFNRR